MRAGNHFQTQALDLISSSSICKEELNYTPVFRDRMLAIKSRKKHPKISKNMRGGKIPKWVKSNERRRERRAKGQKVSEVKSGSRLNQNGLQIAGYYKL